MKVKAESILTIREVADYLRVVEKTVYRLLAKNEIPAFKVGGSWRFRKSEIDKWIAEQESTNKKSEGAIL